MKFRIGWQCLHSIKVLDPTAGAHRWVSCGRCLPCCIRREQEWVLRMLLERSWRPYSVFVTLTYSDPSRPFDLRYDHAQKFLKSVRKRHPRETVRFCCRFERGENTMREHAHMLIFSTGPTFPGFGILEDDGWPHGALHIQPVTQARMRYLAKYVHNSFLTDRGSETVWQTSRRPGIGVEGIRHLASLYAERARFKPVTLPTVLRVGKCLYPLSRTMREHFRDAFVKNAGIVETGEGTLEWSDLPHTVLRARLRRKTETPNISLHIERLQAEKDHKDKLSGKAP